ncbi:hypothetical protein [Chitinophaga sp. S165]|uniref:hypothetical protein n=1 Tax=Chitinophaga sp. S165 TaxID=2135462 RepID=UPI000D70C430|nr:hypothetical protein [Chitinophaga sp. S165]PWV55882.1 hypothetical protein C7475_101392 [Chitinophaga sp. S165]
MAKQSSIITFTGKLGNLIGYQRNGKYFLRSMPEIVRQTANTRRAAKRFGMISKKAALIRNAFYDDLDIRCDSSHINRLNRMLITAAGDHAAVTGFRFNQYAGTDRFFSIAPRLFRNGILHIPPQTLAQHKDLTALEVKVIATRIDFNTHHVTGTETAIMEIDPHEPFSGADVALDVPGKGTLIITLQVRGLLKDGPSANRQYLAADIIAVMAPQMPVTTNRHNYRHRIILPSIRSEHPASVSAIPHTIKRE